MTRAAILLIGVGLASAAAARPADPLPGLIGNRVAGDPVDCIEVREIDRVRLIPGVGFFYSMRTGGTDYLNRVTAGRTFLHDGVLPVVERASPRLCSVETVRLLNENSRAPIASATLGPFIPYRRVTP